MRRKSSRTTQRSAPLVGSGENYEIFAVRWPAVRHVHGEGLLLVPKGEKVADIIAIPDADQTPSKSAAWPTAFLPNRNSPAAWPKTAAASSCHAHQPRDGEARTRRAARRGRT